MRTIDVQENIRKIILEAADRLLAPYGYKKMTMDDLAHEVGIGKGTIYLHFCSKEEIVLSHVIGRSSACSSGERDCAERCRARCELGLLRTGTDSSKSVRGQNGWTHIILAGVVFRG